MTIQEIISLLDNYRTQNNISYSGRLLDSDLNKLCFDLNTWISQLSFETTITNENVIPYSGKYGTVKAYQVAKGISDSSDSLSYISDVPAGSLLNDLAFSEKLTEAVGDLDLAKIILSGNNSKYSFGNNLCINDFVSKLYMETNAFGDVNPLVLSFDVKSTFFRTELHALANNSSVTSVGGIPRERLLYLLEHYSDLGVSLEDVYTTIGETFKNNTIQSLESVPIEIGTGGKILSYDLTNMGYGKVILDPGEYATDILNSRTSTMGKDVFFLLSDDDLYTRMPDMEDFLRNNDEFRYIAKEIVKATDEGVSDLPRVSVSDSPSLDKYKKLSGFIGKAGTIVDVIQCIDACINAKEKHDKGDDLGAAEELSNWLLSSALSDIAFAHSLPLIMMLGATCSGPLIGGIYTSTMLFAVSYMFGELGSTLNYAIFSFLDRFIDSEQIVSPLILDLDGDGVETLGVTSGVHFDLDNSGFAETTGWVGLNDGLLVRDINNDGIINNGLELFGDHTRLSNGLFATNGFAALADLDSNHDGIINSSDEKFSELKIWKDINQNGITDSGELFTLTEAGVESINVNYTSSRFVDEQGNSHSQIGSYTGTNGQTNSIEDVWFKVDTISSVPTVTQNTTSTFEETAEIASLPDLPGFGNVYSLHQAMLADETGTLKNLVTLFANSTNYAEQKNLINEIIYSWTNASNISSNSRGGCIDARKLVAMENMFGTAYNNIYNGNIPGTSAGKELNNIFNSFAETICQLLIIETQKANVFEGISLTCSSDATRIVFDISNMVSNAMQLSNSDLQKKELIRIFNYLKIILGDQIFELTNYQEVKGDMSSLGNSFLGTLETLGNNDTRFTAEITGSSFDDEFTADSLNTFMYGDDGYDTLTGSGGDDILLGDSGNDVLHGGGGNDLLNGGYDDDTLYGESGNDTYIFSRGYGKDTIINNDYINSSLDVVVFKGLHLSDVTIKREYNDLLILINDTNDTLTISNFFSSAEYSVDKLIFDDETVTFDQIIETVMNDNDNSNIIRGYYLGSTINGNGGSDTIIGGKYNDIINGGLGTDLLQGGYGNDTYVFDVGFGHDTIDDAFGSNIVIFGPGLNRTSAQISFSYAELIISFDTGDVLRVEDFLEKANIEEFQFADGSTWSQSYIKNELLTVSEYSDSVGIFDLDGTIDTLDGDDNVSVNDYRTIVHAGNGDDTISVVNGAKEIYGDSGNDRIQVFSSSSCEIYGGDGDDVISDNADSVYGGVYMSGGNGNDVLNGYNKDDILDGGTGDDILKGSDYRDTIYIFGTGYGHDTIDENAQNNTAGNDTNIVRFTAGITSNDIVIRKCRWDLKIYLNGSNDVLTIKNNYLNSIPIIRKLEFSDGTTMLESEIRAAAIEGITIEATSGQNNLVGTNGNDTISASAGYNTLDGLEGDDRLEGRLLADTYIFGRGYGIDTIKEIGNGISPDKVSFKSDVLPTDISIYRVGNNLELRLNGNAGDKIIIEDYYTAAAYRVEEFHFTNGTIWKKSYIDNNVINLNESTGLVGGPGNDTITGNSSDNVITGGSGADTLNGGDGNDTLDGGSGNDVLEGGNGSDIYIFAKGYGKDVVKASRNTVLFGDEKCDTLKMIGILPEDVYLKCEYAKLYICLKDTCDSVELRDWYRTDNKIGFVEFADGTKWDYTYIKNRLLASSNYGDIIADDTDDCIINSQDGDDYIYDISGNATIDAGAGDDFVYNNFAVDSSTTSYNVTIHGGAGNDTISSKGNVTLFGDDGDDVIYSDDILATDIANLDGGLGNDEIHASGENNNIVFGRGYGSDVVRLGGSASSLNRILFKEGISESDVTYAKYNKDLYIEIAGTKDRLIIKEAFSNYGKPFVFSDSITSVFSNGTEHTSENILNSISYIYGGNSSHGDDTDNLIISQGGTIYGYSGNDIFESNGKEGTFIDSEGNDCYRITGRYTEITIIDDGGNDVVETGVDMLNTIFQRNGNNLLLKDAHTQADITIKDWYSNTNSQIETVESEDGYSITNLQLQLLIENMATFTSNNNISWTDAVTSGNPQAQSILSQFWVKETV